MHLELVRAKGAMLCVQRRCNEMGIHNVMIKAYLFNTLVAPILNFGCEVWGVYHCAPLANAEGGWGDKGEAEKLQRMFLRGAFGGLPETTTGVVMMEEAARSPKMHSWFN